MTTLPANDRVETASPSRPTARRPAPPLRRVGNVFVRGLLRSPLHSLLSSAVALITVRGRKSGREITLPVQYALSDRVLYVLVGDHENKTWWRNLIGGAAVRVRVRGVDRDGAGEALIGEKDRETVREALAVYLPRFPAAARRHGIAPSPDGTFDEDQLRAAAGRVVLVRVRLAG